MVYYLGGLSSGWSIIWVASHLGGLIIWVASHPRSLIIWVASHPRSLIILVASHLGGLSLGWPLIWWSIIRVASYLGGLPYGKPLILVVHAHGFHRSTAAARIMTVCPSAGTCLHALAFNPTTGQSKDFPHDPPAMTFQLILLTRVSLVPGGVFGGWEGDVTHGKWGGGHLLYWQCQIFGHCLVHVIAVKLC